MKKNQLQYGIPYSSVIFIACLTFAFFIFASFSHAITVTPMSLSQIVDHSGTLLHGIVTDVESEKDQKNGIVCTWTTIRVIEDLKGNIQATEYTFKQFGGFDKQNHVQWPSPSVVLKPGQEIILCLYPPSRWGLTSPVGFTQGIFHVKSDPQTKEKTLSNGMSKSVLFPEKQKWDPETYRKRSEKTSKIMSALEQCQSMKLGDVKQGLKKIIGQQKTHAKTTRLQQKKMKNVANHTN